MRNTILAGMALALGMAAAPVGAQQEGAPGQAPLGTGETGGAPGATGASGTQGGPLPDPALPAGGTTAGQGTAAQEGKVESGAAGATGGVPGTPAAPGTQGGCPPKVAGQAQPSEC
jgi:hypothetical protein